MELSEVVRNSELIAEGTVQKVEARWDANQRLIYTYIDIRTAEKFKGAASSVVTVKLPGGTVGGITLDVAGMPQFQVGEHAIVFLSAYPDRKNYNVVGLNQGLYAITEDVAVSNISGVELLDPKTGQSTRPLFVQSVPVEEFRKIVRQLVKDEKR